MFLENVVIHAVREAREGLVFLILCIKSSLSRNANFFLIIISCPLSRDARDVVT